MNIKPYGHRVAVVDPPVDDENKSESGLYLPPSAHQEPIHCGIVHSVGQRYDQSVDYQDWTIEEGDKLWYPQSCAKVVGDVKIIDVDCIIAIEKKENA